MTDRRQVPVETVSGWQPGSSGGERILVALAALALVGAVLIVAGNLLHKDDAVSVASASPRPTSTPSPTPLPSPTVMELVAPPESSTQATPSPPALFGGWITASVDLPIRDGPDDLATVVGTLPAGTLAYADEQTEASHESGWMTIEAPEPTGWVATRADGRDLVERNQPAGPPASGAFQRVAGGAGGFVAIANLAVPNPAIASNASYAPIVVTSSDGVAWHAASQQPASNVGLVGVAWGPSGWLLLASDYDTGWPQLWSSPDGDRWTPMGTLESGYPDGLAGSSAGYLLSLSGGGFGRREEVWFSADGIRWTHSDPGLTGYYQVTGTPVGFYATTGPGLDSQSPKGAFSVDGTTWSPNLPNLFIAAVGGALVGIEPHADGLGGHPLHGSFYHGQVRWRPLQGGDGPFAGAVITSIASDGTRAVAFGWDPTTEASFAWTSVGGPWTRESLSSAFGGPPSTPAASSGRVVVVGNRWNPRGMNPVVWHRGANGGWEPEPSPVLGLAPDPSTEGCGAPVSTLDLTDMDPAMLAACGGDATLTLRAWSSACDGCIGSNDGVYAEEWLASPRSNLLYLSPVKWIGQWWSLAVLAEALGPEPDPAWLDQWLELTGHFDDPASVRCRWSPPSGELPYYGGSQSIVEGCREQFVVTAVQVVDGP